MTCSCWKNSCSRVGPALSLAMGLEECQGKEQCCLQRKGVGDGRGARELGGSGVGG